MKNKILLDIIKIVGKENPKFAIRVFSSQFLILGNVQFTLSNRTYTSLDENIVVNLISHGVPVSFEDAVKNKNNVTVTIDFILPNPRIVDKDEEGRVEQLNIYFKNIGFETVKVKTFPYPGIKIPVHPNRRIIQKYKGQASFSHTPEGEQEIVKGAKSKVWNDKKLELSLDDFRGKYFGTKLMKDVYVSAERFAKENKGIFKWLHDTKKIQDPIYYLFKRLSE